MTDNLTPDQWDALLKQLHLVVGWLRAIWVMLIVVALNIVFLIFAREGRRK